MKVDKILNGLEDIDSKYFCGSATLLNLVALLYIYGINNKKLINIIITLAIEDKDYFALSTKAKLNIFNIKKIRIITSHYLYVINSLKNIIKDNQAELLINNYNMLIDLLGYSLSGINLDKDYKEIKEAKKLLGVIK